MTQTFKLEVFEGHLIVLHEGLEILIDTGSPVTLSNLDQIELMGNTYQCHNQMVGCTFDSIKEMLGRDIDVLLGMDVLRNYRLLVNCQVGLLKMSDESLTIKDATSVQLHPAIMNSGVAVEATVAVCNWWWIQEQKYRI